MPDGVLDIDFLRAAIYLFTGPMQNTNLTLENAQMYSRITFNLILLHILIAYITMIYHTGFLPKMACRA